MKHILSWWVVSILLLATATALDLADYPEMFRQYNSFDVTFVVGDNAAIADAIGAVDIATSLQYYSQIKLESSAKLASEITKPKSQNLIVVGGPCANSIAAMLLDYPEDCMEGYTKGKAQIQLFDFDGVYSLLVAGATATDTRRACRVLAHYTDYGKDFTGSEVEISGTNMLDLNVRKVR